MLDTDITAFAEMLLIRFGKDAGAEALRRARHCRQTGDSKNADAWMRVCQKLITFGLPNGGVDSHIYV